MAFSRGNMKELSCFQVVLALLFFIFGLVDRFQVKLGYSFVAIPCWASFFLLSSGVVGLVAANRLRQPSSTLLNMAWSLSIGSVILSSLIIFFYVIEINAIVFDNKETNPYTGEEEPATKYSKEERKQLAILSFILILALAEMIIGLGIAANCRGGDESYMRFYDDPMPAVAAPQASQMPNAVMQQQPVVAIPVGPTY